MNRRIASSFVLLPLACSVPFWPPLVIGNRVVPPLASFAMLATIGLSLLWRGHRTTATTAAKLVTVPFLAIILVFLIFDRMTTWRIVLPKEGPNGCRIVGVESAFLMGGSGKIATIKSPLGFAKVRATYTADDGGRPFSYKTYSLHWQGDTATLELSNTGGPIWPSTHVFNC